jgi:hypothetical protein
MDPNDLIDSIVDAIDYAEIARDLHGLIKARRLLNNDLRQAIDLYVQDEVIKLFTPLWNLSKCKSNSLIDMSLRIVRRDARSSRLRRRSPSARPFLAFCRPVGSGR